MDNELKYRELFEAGVYALKEDKRFLAILDYLEFIYDDLKENYEYQTDRDAQIGIGEKRLLKSVIANITLNMEEKVVDEDYLP